MGAGHDLVSTVVHAAQWYSGDILLLRLLPDATPLGLPPCLSQSVVSVSDNC